MQNTLYIKTPVSKPPEEDIVYHVFTSDTTSYNKGLRRFCDGKFEDGARYETVFWLRPISESDHAIEFGKWLMLKCEKWYDEDRHFSTEELYKIFNEQLLKISGE